MKIPCHTLAIMGTVFVITPDDSGTAIGASCVNFATSSWTFAQLSEPKRSSPDSNTTVGMPTPGNLSGFAYRRCRSRGRTRENREWLRRRSRCSQTGPTTRKSVASSANRPVTAVRAFRMNSVSIVQP